MATLTPQDDSSSVDWQTTKPTVRDRIAFLFNNSLMSDIKFVVTDSQHESDGIQVRVPAHKLVLAISSPVFEAMFYGDLAEKGEEIELPDTESLYLLEFLRFTYCDEIHLTADNAFGVLYLAQKYMVPLLADKCWSFIDENTCVCLRSDAAVSTLNHGNLASLLQRDTLHIKKEVDLFNAVKDWSEAYCKTRELEPTGEALRTILGEALYLIRFPTTSLQEFARQVVPSGLLTDKEALDMHQYFHGVIPARDIKFSERYRTGVTSDVLLHECCRHCNTAFDSARNTFKFGRCEAPLQPLQSENVEEISETLDFTVKTRNVHLKGVHLFTSTVKATDATFYAEVRLLDEDGNGLTAETGKFWENEKSKIYVSGQYIFGIVVKFKDPVLIWKSCKYTLQIKLQGVDGAKLQKLKTSFAETGTANDVTFKFKGISCSIYKLLFYKFD